MKLRRQKFVDQDQRLQTKYLRIQINIINDFIVDYVSKIFNNFIYININPQIQINSKLLS
ncbi:unnamed protein product [Paramecium sonneborni]|uniref:Uncharacterized protein n=1 Tax=Paramecium sonneborni TaxID=65129 RepID=A0A8S1R773_9CILI|nr:unnamed protein product [Paramecium sonneborni]